jgi:ABC-type dipeptide/oligopeptide/nickel transport system permease component
VIPACDRYAHRVRQSVVRTIGPGVLTLLLTALGVAVVTRLLLERVSLDGLVLNLLLRNRDAYAGMALPNAVTVAIGRSLVLIVGATTIATVFGLVFAIIHFTARYRIVRGAAWALGTVGVSLPSFFWAMLLQLFVISWYLATGRGLLPTTGYGLDEHVVLPLLALSMRPTAYVFRTAATALEEIAARDYVRTARAKGLLEPLVLVRHMFPNARPTFLAGIGYASRSVLSSLAIVEYLFTWNGAGFAFIYAVANRNVDFAVALVVALASIFALISVVLALLSRTAPKEAVAAAA